jgi:SAM-dependent methyltransferase
MNLAQEQIGVLKVQVKRLVAAIDRRRNGNVGDQHDRRRGVFQAVYHRGVWGKDETSPFFSGLGSNGPAAQFYVEQMAVLLTQHARELGRPLSVVDIGCGDFRIGKALVERVPELNYLGCDIVPELVAHNAKNHASERVHFQTLDAVCDPLPKADVCLVRQVFQHLSNADIQSVLASMRYPVVYVTEGHPVRKRGSANPDKVVGPSVRFDWQTGQGRGVELSEAPYCLHTQEVFRLAVPPNEVLVTEQLRMARHQRNAAAV